MFGSCGVSYRPEVTTADAGAFFDMAKAATHEDAVGTENSGSLSAPRKAAAIHGRVKFTVI